MNAVEQPRLDAGQVAMKVLLRMRDAYEISAEDMGRVLGVSGSQVRRYRQGTDFAAVGTLQRALMFIRAARSLETLVGGDTGRARVWLFTKNSDLRGERPIDLLMTIEGMVDVVKYLDAMRG